MIDTYSFSNLLLSHSCYCHRYPWPPRLHHYALLSSTSRPGQSGLQDRVEAIEAGPVGPYSARQSQSARLRSRLPQHPRPCGAVQPRSALGATLQNVLDGFNVCTLILTRYMAHTPPSGGKGGATTIDNDHQFSVAIKALLVKDQTKCSVAVEFDVDSMDGYRIRTRVSFICPMLQLYGLYVSYHSPCSRLMPTLTWKMNLYSALR